MRTWALGRWQHVVAANNPFEAERRQDHLEVSRLSRAGRLVVAERSGHHIQIEQPDLVIQAIRDVVLPTTGRK